MPGFIVVCQALSNLDSAASYMDPPKVSEAFPEGGGDLCLVSNDGTLFYVHSQLLQLSSPVFATMCEIGDKSGKVGNGPADPVRIEADEETLQLLLQYIYPLQPDPRLEELQEVEALLSLAHRYELGGVTKQLRAVLTETRVEGDIVSKPLYQTSPLMAFAIASKYQLDPEARLALRDCLTMNTSTLLQIADEINIPTKLITFMLRLRQQRINWFSSKLDGVEIPRNTSNVDIQMTRKLLLERRFNQMPDLSLITVKGTILATTGYAGIYPQTFQEWEREWNQMQAKLPELPSK